MTDQPQLAKPDSKQASIIHSVAMMGLLVVLGFLLIWGLRTSAEISETENRRLAVWPTYTFESLREGRYTREIETYVADHFPGRAWFTEWAFAIRTHRGIHREDRIVQVKGAETGFEDVSQWAGSGTGTGTGAGTGTGIGTAPEAETPLDANASTHAEATTDVGESEKATAEIAPPVIVAIDVPEAAAEVVASKETSKETDAVVLADVAAVAVKPIETNQASNAPVAQAPVASAPVVSAPPSVTPPKVTSSPVKSTPDSTPHKPNKPLNVVGGVLLHEGQALFMFQGTDRGAQGYANAVNTWVELVARPRPGMTATVVVTPTSSHFYLPPHARAKTTSEPKNLAAMRSALLPEVRFAEVIPEMEGHQDQPLFFKSDHHWTGLGAYYAYRAWAKAVGVTPLELADFDKRSVPGVAGSFWSLTQAPELRQADKESFYYVPKTVTFDGMQYAGPAQKTPIPQSFFAEKSKGYIVFLGGDIPLLVANTNAGTGRTALVIKNSYGNAFAPYLLPHFDRVVVLDYRYVFRNIQDIVESFKVTDLVFVNATITANSGAHQERMRQVARGSSTAWLTEAEKRRVKQDQDAAAKVQTGPDAPATLQ